MLSFILVILCINIDAFSYGVAYGLKKQRFNPIYILFVSLLSTLLFTVPLLISKYVFEFLNPTLCHIINGLALISLGIYYFLQKSPKINKNSDKNLKIESINNTNYYFPCNYNKNRSVSENPNKINNIYKKITIKSFFIETLVISIDAIFTALLSGFNSNLLVFYIFFYAFSNFFAIFFGNLIFYNSDKILKIKLSFFSGIIFIILGFLKFFGI